jgi:hypothetical protein
MRRRRSLVRLCRLPWLAPSGHRRPTHRGLRRPGIRVAVSSKQNADNSFSTSDPGMSMKTKGSVKRSRAGADVAFERLRCAEGAVWSDCAACPGLSLRDIASPAHQGLRQPGSARFRTGVRREQSENVYENKGSLWQTPPDVRSSADLRVSREGRTATDMPT